MRSPPIMLRKMVLAFLGALGLICTNTLADKNWKTSVSSGSWNTASNWVEGSVPVLGDNVFISFADSSGHTIAYNGSFVSSLTLQVQNMGSGSVTLGVSNSYGLQVGSLDIGASGRGCASQSNGTVTMTGLLYLGSGTGGTGTYLLSGGSLSVGATQYVGQSGNGYFIQSGGTATISGHEYIGVVASGGVSQSGGMHTVGTTSAARDLFISFYGGSSGRFTLSDSGVLNVFGREYVGSYGLGTFDQSGGVNNVGTTSALKSLYVGGNSGGAGTYLLSGAGVLNVSGTEYLGGAGPGTFSQSGGVHAVGTSSTAADLRIGDGGNDVGTYLLGGGTLSVSGNEYVGNSGTGTFNQSSGLHQIGSDSGPRGLYLGYISSGRGTYVQSGGTLKVSGNEYLGYAADGSFGQSSGTHTIGTGSAPTSLYLGGFNGRGTFALSGNAVLNVNGDEIIGNSGVGTFIQTGGQNNVGFATTARSLTIAASGSGTYQMSGSAILNVNGFLTVGGPTSTGLLDITGGTATISETLRVTNAGANAFNLSGGEVCVGTLNLSGNASRLNWTGGTLRIKTSALSADGTLTVPGAGTLGGSGTIARATDLTPGGVLDPGASVGKLTFTNDLTLQSSGASHAILNLEVGGAPEASNAGVTYDQVVVRGSGSVFTVGGATLRLITLPGIVVNQPYQIVQATSGGSVDFTSKFSNLSSGTNYSDAYVSYAVSYNTNTGVFVTFSMVPEPSFLAGVAMLLFPLRRRRYPTSHRESNRQKSISVALQLARRR